MSIAVVIRVIFLNAHFEEMPGMEKHDHRKRKNDMSAHSATRVPLARQMIVVKRQKKKRDEQDVERLDQDKVIENSRKEREEKKQDHTREHKKDIPHAGSLTDAIQVSGQTEEF
jgi:hypothetical protein